MTTSIDDLEARDDIVMSTEPVTITSLKFDTADWGGYQRHVSDKAVNRIVHGFNPAMFEPITVSMREDGTMWVIDGHHRAVAASRMGRETVPARVIYGLDRTGEAELFRELAKSRLPLSKVDEHNAALSSKDPEAIAVQAVLDDRGFYLVSGNTSAFREIGDDPFPIMAVGAVYWVYRLDHGETLGKVLDVVRGAWATVSPADGLRQSMIRGLGIVLHTRKDEVDIDRLVTALGRTSPISIRANAQAEIAVNTRMSAPNAYALTIAREYNKGLRRNAKKLSLEGMV